MLGTGYPDFFWLNLTNVLLGAVTIGFVAVTLWAIFEELWTRYRTR